MTNKGKLSAKELMLGDWVYYDPNVFIEDEYETTKEVQTTQILNGEDIDIAIDECYYPVSLTDDILEKNGFNHVHEENADIWYINNKFVLIEKEIYNGLYEIGINICGSYIPINFVHELQHALKLCKIEKEIKL